MLVSWIAHLPRCAAEVQAEIKITFAPSPRPASNPVRALVIPGPAVVNTTTGRLVAK